MNNVDFTMFLCHMFLEFPNNFNIGSNSWSSIFQIFSFIKQTKIFGHIHVSLLYILTLKISQDFAYKLIGASSVVTILAKTVNNSKICLLWQQQNLNSHLKYLSGDKPDLTNRGKIGTTSWPTGMSIHLKNSLLPLLHFWNSTVKISATITFVWSCVSWAVHMCLCFCAHMYAQVCMALG